MTLCVVLYIVKIDILVAYNLWWIIVLECSGVAEHRSRVKKIFITLCFMIKDGVMIIFHNYVALYLSLITFFYIWGPYLDRDYLINHKAIIQPVKKHWGVVLSKSHELTDLITWPKQNISKGVKILWLIPYILHVSTWSRRYHNGCGKYLWYNQGLMYDTISQVLLQCIYQCKANKIMIKTCDILLTTLHINAIYKITHVYICANYVNRDLSGIMRTM